MKKEFSLMENLYYNLRFIIILIPFISFSQSKKQIIYYQNQKIDSLNEALEIEKNNFIKAEKKFIKNNEQMKIINESIINWHDQYVNLFHNIDFHIIKCPNAIKKDADLLVNYFNEVATTDLEKARAIYVWMAYNIKYDDDAYNSDNLYYQSAEDVLNAKKAVCGGYAELFTFFGQKMNLEVRTLSGFAKGYGYTKGDSFAGAGPDHAWNMVKIDGEWKIFDVTWGAGSGKTSNNGKLVSKQEFDDNWFNVSPYEAIFSHYPENISDLLIEPRILLKDFEQFPEINISAFKTSLLNAKETLSLILKDKKYAPPIFYSLNSFIKVIKAPKNGELLLNTKYFFELYAPRAKSIMLIDDDGNYLEFKKSVNEPLFTLNYTQSNKGIFSISLDFYNEKNPWVFLEYNVK
jgi:hypothetical protein